MSDKQADYEIIEPPSDLRSKVGKADDVLEMFSAADSAIGSLGAQFVARLPDELSAISEAFEALKASPQGGDAKSHLFHLVHDLKGQAGTFDYGLITVIGNDLCRFIERPMRLNPKRLQVIGFHIDAMKLVVDKRITGEDHPHGVKMVDTLREMTRKVLKD